MTSTKAISGLLIVLLFGSATARNDEPGPPRLLRQEEVTVTVSPAALLRQYAALSAMPSVEVTYTPRGTAWIVKGDLGMSVAGRVDRLRLNQEAPEMLELFKDVLLAEGDETLVVEYIDGPQPEGTRSVRFTEAIGGIPVIHGQLALRLRADSGTIEEFSAAFLANRDLPRAPVVTAEQAVALAQKALRGSGIARPETVTASGKLSLAYLGAFPDSTHGQLVWVVKVRYVSADGSDHFHGDAWIDAIDGSYVGQEPSSANAVYRTAYSADRTTADTEQFSGIDGYGG